MKFEEIFDNGDGVTVYEKSGDDGVYLYVEDSSDGAMVYLTYDQKEELRKALDW